MAAVDAGTRTLVPKQTNGRAFGQRIASPSVITLKPAIRYQFKTGHGIGLRRDCFTLPQRTFASRGLSD
jgi:hypothetical protein